MKRNLSIELFRCLLMVSIGAIHVAGFMGGNWRYLSRMSLPCVVAFVFISGYYGVRFSAKKLAVLCGTGAWCALVAALLSIVTFHTGGGGYKLAFSNYKCYWFLHAYTFMMFFAPIIDAALTRENALKLGAPILFLVFGWSFAYSFNAARSFVVGLDGSGQMSGLTLLGIYVFARIFRLLEWESKISSKLALGVIVLTLPLTAVRFGAYDSPIALIVAMVLFVLALRIRIENHLIEQVVGFVTPSLFSIYLLQVNGFAWTAFPKVIAWVREWSPCDIFVFVGLTIAVFLFGLSLDMIRRGVLALCEFLARR